MTHREVMWRMKAIGNRKSDELEMSASLHGKQIKGSGVKVELSKEDQNKMDATIKARMKNGRHKI